MKRKSTTPVPHWQLMQIGAGLAPRWNADTELSYTAYDAIGRVFQGGDIDFYAGKRAPLKQGQFSHVGQYACCGMPGTCGYVVEELDVIQAAKGKYVPVLFFKDYTCCPPTKDTCYITPVCGTWAWAWGKITEVDNKFSTADYFAPYSAEVGFSGVLQTPLREITYQRWRWGEMIDPTAAQAKYTAFELESIIAETPAQWWVPCGTPMFCTFERFWPRDLYSAYTVWDYQQWECKYSRLSPATTTVMQIPGNYPPRTQVIMRGDTKLRIVTDSSDTVFECDAPASSMVYLDSDDNTALEKQWDGTVVQLRGVADVPRLEFFENRVYVDKGFAIIGATPQWIN